MSNFESIGFMHKHFGLPATGEDTVPSLIDDETANFRLKFLREELTELNKGYADRDLEQIADALVDLVVVALGTAHLHGLPWEELFEEVLSANLLKVRVVTPEQSKRFSVLDLMKPTGWNPPDIYKVLKKHGWKQGWKQMGMDLDA